MASLALRHVSHVVRPAPGTDGAPVALLLPVPARDAVALALQRLGFAVPRVTALGDLSSWLPNRAKVVVIASLGGPRGRETAEVLRVLKALSPGISLVLLVGHGDETWWQIASELSPACYPVGLDPEVLASLIHLGCRKVSAEPVNHPAPRRITLRLWDSVEIDGLRPHFGVAERNFLFTLARSADARVGKTEEIDCGSANSTAAAS